MCPKISMLARFFCNHISPRQVYTSAGVVLGAEEASSKSSLASALELSGVLGGLWVASSVVTPGTTLLFLTASILHVSFAERMRRTIFFGTLARHVTSVSVFDESNDSSLRVLIETDAIKRELELVDATTLPEDKGRVTLKELIELGVFDFDFDDDFVNRLKTEDLVILSETSSVKITPPPGLERLGNFKLSDIDRDRLVGMKKQIPSWARSKKIPSAEFIKNQGDRAMSVGAGVFVASGLVSIWISSGNFKKPRDSLEGNWDSKQY